ncbi:MAG: hypothetical protein EA398_13840, partial [Deltaproteobacteria bacterium]
VATAMPAAVRWSLKVFERGSRAGGKAGVVELDGVEVDTGQSVLTMPRVFEAVFARAGVEMAERVELIAPEPAFRYAWPDGTVVDVHAELEWTRTLVAKSLGVEAQRELDAFLAYAGGIWDAAAPNFVFGPAPSFGRMAWLGMTRLRELLRVDPFSTMRGGIEKRVRNPYLRDILLRYATYNGSDPRTAPATLNCISWVELGEGGYGVRGGIHRMVEALEGVARERGVRFTYGAEVERIVVEDGEACAVVVNGERVSADVVVANADVAHVAGALLEGVAGHRVRPADPPSMSGWNAIVRARRGAERRPAHAVLFPERYMGEFEDIFDADRPPVEPTVYVCAQTSAHGSAGWGEAEEALFVMVNAPPEPAEGARPAEVWAEVRERAMGRLRAAGWIGAEDRVVWERTPADLAAAFPGSRGAIYGAASNSSAAAFRRPANHPKRPRHLYLASGSAHPGGGMPLCVRSGLQAADEIGPPR